MLSRHLSDSTGGVYEVKFADNVHLKVRVQPRANHWKATKSCFGIIGRRLAATQNRDHWGRAWWGTQGSQRRVLQSPWRIRENNSSHCPSDSTVSLYLFPVPLCITQIIPPNPQSQTFFRTQNALYAISETILSAKSESASHYQSLQYFWTKEYGAFL